MGATNEVEVPAEFAQALRELGLAGAGVVTGTPLTGGVSSGSNGCCALASSWTPPMATSFSDGGVARPRVRRQK